MIVDAGPLVAILDRDDSTHDRCAAILPDISDCLTTTWPVFTEAMYLLGMRLGWAAQAALWDLLQQGEIRIAALDDGML